jgi:hypothetical protein
MRNDREFSRAFVYIDRNPEAWEIDGTIRIGGGDAVDLCEDSDSNAEATTYWTAVRGGHGMPCPYDWGSRFHTDFAGRCGSATASQSGRSTLRRYARLSLVRLRVCQRLAAAKVFRIPTSS